MYSFRGLVAVFIQREGLRCGSNVATLSLESKNVANVVKNMLRRRRSLSQSLLVAEAHHLEVESSFVIQRTVTEKKVSEQLSLKDSTPSAFGDLSPVVQQYSTDSARPMVGI